MSEACKNCKTPMVVAKNKNGGYYATCPNKMNHGNPGAMQSAAGDETTTLPVPPMAAQIPKGGGGRTVFGW